MPDDADLLIRYAKDRSNEAFTELVGRHLNFVYRTALRQVAGDVHLAEDVAQSVFIDLARKAGTVAGHSVLARWLYTSTHHAAANAVRAEQRRRTREMMARSMEPLSNHPTHDADWASIRPRLDEALRGLNRRDGDALLLRFFEARSFADIGAQLGLEENAARMRVERALERLRAILSRRGITSSSAALGAMLANEAIGAAPAGLATAITHAALAVPAMGSGTVATLLHLMSTTKVILVAGVFALGIGIYEVREARNAQSELQGAQRQFTAEQAGLRDWQKGFTRGEPSPVVPRQTDGSPRGPSPAGLKPQEEAQRFLTEFPAARGLLRSIFAAETAHFYRPFFRSVEMSPAEIKIFEDTLVAYREANLGLTATGFDGGGGPAFLPPDNQLRGILGPQRYQQFQDFLQVRPAYDFTSMAAASSGLAGVPLSTDQQDQLVQVLIKNMPSITEGPLNLAAINWDAVSPQAQAVVSAAQWNSVEAEILRMQYSQALAAAKADRSAPASTDGQ